MKSPFDISFRYKIPLWGSVLIVMTAVAVSASLMAQAYNDLRADLQQSSTTLGRTLAKTLFPPMLHDEVWRAFEVVAAPMEAETRGNQIRPEIIIALDDRQRVFVSSHPRSARVLADVRGLGDEYGRLADRIEASWNGGNDVIELVGTEKIYVAVPVAEQGLHLGTLVMAYSKEVFMARFRSVAWRGALIGLLVLAVLLPVNWYWGQKTTVPLLQVAHGLNDAAHGRLVEPPESNYSYRDELGELFEAYRLLVGALREKALLEQEVIRTERLAAVGRLSAGVAHEINNPLAGMLIALANFKRRSGDDERAQKTVALLERGLMQIRDTVGAMLVDAKVKGRDFAPLDLEDVRLLLSGEAHKGAVGIDIECDLTEPVALPATLVRQILMNLLLNAIHASPASTKVVCAVHLADRALRIATSNAGSTIPSELMDHLFEPFASGNEEGHGLGLWVTYQIVTQLGGQIGAESRDGLTQFRVTLPVGES